MDYDYENFLEIVKRSAILEFIMTKNVQFFEDFDSNKERLDFCKDRDISFLPSNDNQNVYILYF